MYYGHKESQTSICPGPDTAQCFYYVPKVGQGGYLSVVVFQNKLSNVISGSFITHLTEQTTFFVIYHFKKYHQSWR